MRINGVQFATEVLPKGKADVTSRPASGGADFHYDLGLETPREAIKNPRRLPGVQI